MELRHLHYFVAVAEEQNVSQAARRLHVSQPPLSRQIRDLEAEMGVALFERSSKAIRLTEAGQVFLSEARAALQRVEDAVAFTRATAQRKRNRIRVGYGAVPAVEFLPRILRALQGTNPRAKVELRAMSTEKMLRALWSGEIDVSLSVYELPEDYLGLVVEELGLYPLRVAVHRKHNFARLREVPLRAVARQPIIALSKQDHLWYHAMIERLLLPYNSHLQIAEEYDSSQSVIAAVEAERGVAIAYSAVARTAGERIVFRPLKPAPQPLSVVLAYRQEAVTPLVSVFASAARASKLKSP